MICNMVKRKDPKLKKSTFKFASVIEKLVFVEKSRAFWSRETKLLKNLMKDYPDKDFWMKIKFSQKVDSLTWFFSGKLKQELERKYKLKDLTFALPKYEEVKLSKNKCGKSYVLDKKPTTIRDFLSNGKTKKRTNKGK